jgi:hypothetical protein
MQVSFGRRLAIKEKVKENGSTSNEGLQVQLSNLIYTFVMHECGVLCWENRKELRPLKWSFFACMIRALKC